MTISHLIAAALQTTYIVYLVDLQRRNCVCALNWKRDFIMVWSSILLVVQLLFMCGVKLPRWLGGVAGLIGFTNAIIVVQYVQKLDKTSCDCSDSWVRTVMYWLAIAGIILYSFMMAFFLFVVVIAVQSASQIPKRVSRN